MINEFQPKLTARLSVCAPTVKGWIMASALLADADSLAPVRQHHPLLFLPRLIRRVRRDKLGQARPATTVGSGRHGNR